MVVGVLLGLSERSAHSQEVWRNHLKIATDLAIGTNHRYLTASSLLASSPGTDSYAAVIVISKVHDGGFNALDRSCFAPGLTVRLN